MNFESKQKEIDEFLILFKELIEINFNFLSFREKNLKTLSELDNYNKSDVKRELLELEYNNFSSGPLKDHNKTKTGDLWIFGKRIKGKEIYIKIKINIKEKKAICLSFHQAERPLDLPFTKNHKEN